MKNDNNKRTKANNITKKKNQIKTNINDNVNKINKNCHDEKQKNNQNNPIKNKIVHAKKKSTNYETIQEKKKKQKQKAEEPVGRKPAREQKLRFSYLEQREYNTIDEDIQKLEETLEQIEKDMSAAATDFVRLRELTEKKEENEALLEQKMERWVYLTDLAERIEAQNAAK